jgi:hypothetical protein
MENIHVLPTDKPSRFWVTNLGNLARCQDVEPIKKALGNNVNIYITSNEEIKEVDWVIECSLNWIFKMHKHGLPNYNPNKKKIILTTDPDLIKEGVQGIDDEFLEWFVKNPSCESIEVKNISIKVVKGYKNNGEIDCYHTNGYEIIIPKRRA